MGVLKHPEHLPGYATDMLTLKAVEVVQESSKATLEYHVLASSLKAMYTVEPRLSEPRLSETSIIRI